MKNRISNIYDLLSRIPVTGDAVDIMAAARGELRALHQEARIQPAVVDKTATEKTVGGGQLNPDDTDKEASNG